MIDLRSDTFTKPTPEMLNAMMHAEVGDDVWDEDPTVKKLETKAAEMFDLEAGLFCPSGTMTNQIALKVHTRPGDEIICHEYSHIYNYEGGGVAFNSGCQMKFTGGDRGLMSASSVEKCINNPDDVHAARTSLIVAENTCNKGGGSCYDLETLTEIKAVAKQHKLPFHLDGARLFNAITAKGYAPSDFGKLFDSISICLSKGLGAPVGSLILGDKEFIREAKRVRKKFGGGMRQAGFLAAAGIYALDHNIQRLEEDHHHAQLLKEALLATDWVAKVDPVETNIVIFYLNNPEKEKEVINKLAEAGVNISGMGRGKLRMVTYYDIKPEHIKNATNIIKQLKL